MPLTIALKYEKFRNKLNRSCAGPVHESYNTSLREIKTQQRIGRLNDDTRTMWLPSSGQGTLGQWIRGLLGPQGVELILSEPCKISNS